MVCHSRTWRHVERFAENPLKPPGELPATNGDRRYAHWVATNLLEQRQPGYVTVTVALLLGDLTAADCDVSESDIRTKLEECAVEARRQFMSDGA